MLMVIISIKSRITKLSDKMARKIKYKEISEDMKKIAKPVSIPSSRPSIGLDKSVGEFYFLNVDQIVPFKNQARKSFDKEDLSKLADSIREHGICQPLTVIKESSGKYEVISGERRLRASKLVGITKVPCIILKDTQHSNSIALIENIHRNDLTPIELGMAFKKLLEFSVFESQEHLARSISISKGTVSEYISFSEFPEDIRNKLIDHNITSRNKLRNITKALKKNDIQKINSIISGSSDQNKFPILQFFLFGSDIIVKDKGLRNIDDLVKQKLKYALQEFINTL
ncbi:ParB/RepB/Spo0J family partition protein [Candidatus Cardinium hertigii]|uniref:ParB/RepB/Spo0J family partition protein n=1 Tax=Candidatus Cardinium hertigii TaxID=247481 RepID=UPI003D7DC094